MVEYKRILVPTDFSESSKVAIKHAEYLARAEVAQILLAHVLVQSPYHPSGFTIEEIPIQEAPLVKLIEDKLATFAKEFQGDIEVRTVLRRGSAYDQITALAEEEDIDVIVMASQGHSGIERFFLGSVAEKILRRAPCPVVTVPAPE
jgi:universal stress protein A